MSETDTERIVNVPLLRKAVEWAEAEAQKPIELREWEQAFWVLTPEERKRKQEMAALSGEGDDYWWPREIDAFYKAPECGTCYCIAGFIAAEVGSDARGMGVELVALNALDIEDDHNLFDSENSIEDVRRIAEQIAGERL